MKSDDTKGWGAIDPDLALKNYGQKDCLKLEVGDKLFNQNKEWTLIESINKIEEEQIVYHLTRVGGEHNFFVNGFLGHNFSFAVASVRIPPGGDVPCGSSVALHI
jgi:hypothetical protein